MEESNQDTKNMLHSNHYAENICIYLCEHFNVNNR